MPSRIDVDYFRKIIRQHDPDVVDIRNFTKTPAIGPGGNFTSIMLRIHVDLVLKDESIRHKSFIMKITLEDDKGGVVIKELDLFPKEVEMYEKYLPAFGQLYKSIAGWQIEFGPKCLFVGYQFNGIQLIFEDLQVRNFVNVDRLMGCDLNHMTCSLRKLAEFHAVSAVYAEKHGPYPERYQSGFVNKEYGYEFQKNMYHSKAKWFKLAMQQWGLKDIEKYLEKFPTFEQYWRCCTGTLQQEKNAFNVLIHGDLWTSNIMFCHADDQESIKDLVFVDYQLCKWGSPAEDLLFFITISATNDIRLKEFDNFIAIYHERLIECLKALKYSKALPKLRDLHKDLFDERHTFYAFFGIFNHLAVILIPPDKNSNLDNLLRDDELGEQLRLRSFTNSKFATVMRDLYPFYCQRGLFNFNDYDDLPANF